MADPEKKPKPRASHAKKSSSKTGDKTRHHSKKSPRDHSGKPKATDNSEIQKQHEAQVASLQAKITELEAKINEESTKLHSQLTAKDQQIHDLQQKLANPGSAAALVDLQQKVGAKDQQIHKLESQLAEQAPHLNNLQAQVRAAESDKSKFAQERADLQAEISTLTQRLQAASNPMSPRTPKPGDGQIPKWKLLQMEREREDEERRAQEQRLKFTKVSSIKINRGEIHSESGINTGTDRPNFKDPLEHKPHAESSYDPPVITATGSALLGGGKTLEELEAEEEARITKNFGRKK